jgi:hypothetical protein
MNTNCFCCKLITWADLQMSDENIWLAPTIVVVGVLLVFICSAILIILWRIMQIMKIPRDTHFAVSRTKWDKQIVWFPINIQNQLIQACQVGHAIRRKPSQTSASSMISSCRLPIVQKSTGQNYVNGAVVVVNEQKSSPRCARDPLVYTDVMPASRILRPDTTSRWYWVCIMYSFSTNIHYLDLPAWRFVPLCTGKCTIDWMA